MKIRIQVSAKYQVFEVEQEIDNVETAAEQAAKLRTFANTQLNKLIEDQAVNKVMTNKPAPQAQASQSKVVQEQDETLAVFKSNGKPVMSKDNKQLTKDQFRACAEAELKPWETNMAVIEKMA